MLDPRYIRDNLEAVAASIKARNMSVSLSDWQELAQQRSALLRGIEEINHARKQLAARTRGAPPGESDIAAGKELREQLTLKEEELRVIEERYTDLLNQIPNMLHEQVPVGTCDADNRTIRTWGVPREFDFTPLDHLALAQQADLVDFEQAARVSGAKFYYLKNEAVLLEQALINFSLEILRKKKYTLFTTPDVAQEGIVHALGFNPRGQESNTYLIEGTTLCLIGTAEITLGAYHAAQKIAPERLPIRMGGISHCFRREAGSAGKASKGLYRVHQFSKVEMFVVCSPEDSEAMHAELLEIEEEIFQHLEIPYRVVEVCSAELGAPAYRKFDIEAWMPGRIHEEKSQGDAGVWGEVTSTSNCTDYQARRLHVRTTDDSGANVFAHMLNGTAVATSRAVIAILENGQQKDGSITLPKALHKYLGFTSIPAKREQ